MDVMDVNYKINRFTPKTAISLPFYRFYIQAPFLKVMDVLGYKLWM